MSQEPDNLVQGQNNQSVHLKSSIDASLPVDDQSSCMRRLIPLLLILIAGIFQYPAGADSISSSDDLPHQEMNEIIKVVSEEITDSLTTLDDANARSAEKLSDSDMSSDEVSKILNTKVVSSPYALSSLVITPEGKVTAAAPDTYENLLGEELGGQEIVQYANQVKRPVLSDVFLMKEGFYGISLSYPIFSDTREYLGYTDITFRPGDLLRQYIVPAVEENRYDMFILQTDGLNVYETNEEEIGKNTLTDPLYADPEIHKVAVAITGNVSGVIQYHFWNRNWDKTVLREAVWDTLTFDDQVWRIAVVRDVDEETNNKILATVPAGVVDTDLNASIADLTRFVDNAAGYTVKEGKEKAIASFNNLSGPFVSEERYIFAYDMNGTTLALPYQEGLIGKNRNNITDVNGLEIMPGLRDLAASGGGIMYYVYPNPAAGYQPQLKLVYLTPVDDKWFIGSGIYLPSIQAVINRTEKDKLLTRVQNAVIHAGEVGKEKAITDFNDINGSYADGGAYIFAYGYDGTTLAMPHQPGVIGTNRMSYTDTYGCPITRMEIDAARRDGGYVYVVYYNPDSRNDELKLCYVCPAGDNWMVGSGIYFSQGLGGNN